MQRISITNPQNVIDGTAKKYYFRLRNTGGPKGDKGDKGDTGATGPQGPQGNAATVSVGSTTTLPVGYDATVTNTGSIYNAVLNFGIPQGPQGPQGAKGDKGDTGAKGDTGPRGPQGEKGTNATVYVGTTSTLAPGSQATVYNSGSDSNAVLNFGIPQGAKGDTGIQGPQGPAGQNFAPTVVAELPATGDESKLYLTPKAHTSQTATGNPITANITDGAGALESFKLDGDTFQQTYTGKNLLDPKATPGQILNVTYEVIGQDLKITDTDTSGNYHYVMYKFSNLTPGQKYTASFQSVTASSGTPTGRVLFATYGTGTNPNSNIGGVEYPDNSYTFTVPGNATSIGISFYARGGSGSTYTYSQIMLEESESATDYEPYVGGIPSPNPDHPQAVQTVTGEQTVTIAGKNYKINLSDNELEIPDGTLTNNGVKCIMGSNSATITRTSADSGTSFIRYQLDTPITIHSGETFTLYAGNIDTIGDKTTDGTYMSVRLRRSNNTDDTDTDAVLGNINAKTTITATEDVTYTHFVVRTSSSLYPDNLVITPRLIIGQDNSIELCKLGTYQDYIYKDGDSWKVHKSTGKYTFTGSEDGWLKSGSSTSSMLVGAIAIQPLDISIPTSVMQTLPKSNYFTIGGTQAIGIFWIYNQSGGYAQYARFGIAGTSSSTVDDIKNWLSSHNTDLYYPTTTTDTIITDQTLIAQLEAIRTAALETGANTISNAATGSNLAGDMEISYYGYNPTNRYDKFIWLDLNNNYEQIGE